MNSKTEALVLHAVKYGEQRLVVDMFTRQHGRVSFIVALPRSPRSKVKKQYFQPLTLLSIEADIRSQANLQKLRDVALLTPLPSLLSHPSKLAIALFVAEFLYRALRDEQQTEPLFDYVQSAIEWLDGQTAHIANFHLVFLMRLSRFLGFYPNLDSEGDYFDLRGATFCAVPPPHRDVLLPDEAARLRTLMRMDFSTMYLFHMNREQRARILDTLLLYYRLHLPSLPELHSVVVLRELFD